MARLTCVLVAAALFKYCAVASSDAWHEMPDRWYYHVDCIHRFDEEFHVSHLSDGVAHVTFAHGDRDDVVLPPCPVAPRRAPPGHDASTAYEDLTQSGRASLPKSPSYYSDWVVYAQTVHERGFGSMTSDWKVPAKPASQGPLPPLISSSIYFFNALENSHGSAGTADVILQPVLQFGKSGCLLNPLKFGDWYFTSYQVGINGRAYCGPSIGPLEEGETLRGSMTLTNASSNTWRVLALRMKTGETSSHSTALGSRVLDAAYATLEGMVIYNCKAFPASGSLEFSNNSLLGTDGTLVKPTWQKMQGHTECSQNVEVSASGDSVVLTWDPHTAKPALENVLVFT